MKNNVINYNKSKLELPKDLLTFKEVQEKYNIKYHTLYKYTRTLNEIPFYAKGGLKVSELDIIHWLNSGLVPARG